MRSLARACRRTGPLLSPGWVILVLAGLAWTAGPAAAGAQEEPVVTAEARADYGGDELGTVSFEVSCTPEARERFERGLALLHHMMYTEAERVFRETADLDPGCAMAHWGLAMTGFQPLWPRRPEAERLERGRAQLERARQIGLASEKEEAFVEAAEAFYRDPGASHASRLEAWESAMRDVYRAHPEDPGAAAFYALSLLATAPPEDKSLSHQRRAAEILSEVHERAPSHPGGIHYAIHAHDFPPLAEAGEEVARRYDRIAPHVAHALHMPSHIFTRLGQWSDVISWNLRSADAALEVSAGGATSHHYPHALDYLAYAYLQQGRDDAAARVLEDAVSRESYQPSFSSAYALAAMPARLTLERRDWAGAAAVEPRIPETLPWERFPGAEALTRFARGIGAARSGDVESAGREIEALAGLEDRAREIDEPYWAEQIRIQRLAVEAWSAFAEGEVERAVRLMRESADREAATEKNPVTPGAVLPARELLGDLLMETEEPDGALEAYEASLETSPRRFNALLGAARAAKAAGDTATALRYHEALVEVTERYAPGRGGSFEVSEVSADP